MAVCPRPWKPEDLHRSRAPSCGQDKHLSLVWTLAESHICPFMVHVNPFQPLLNQWRKKKNCYISFFSTLNFIQQFKNMMKMKAAHRGTSVKETVGITHDCDDLSLSFLFGLSTDTLWGNTWKTHEISLLSVLYGCICVTALFNCSALFWVLKQRKDAWSAIVSYISLK